MGFRAWGYVSGRTWGQGFGLEGLGFELRFRGRGRKRYSSEVTSNKHDYKPCNNFVPSASKQAFEITFISAYSQPTVGQKEEEEEEEEEEGEEEEEEEET